LTRIPRYIDDPPTILFWDVDEIAVICICMVVGIITGELTKFIIGGLIVSKVIGKLKKDRSDGYLQHILYWWGIMSLKGLPPSYKRSFIE
jgi:conjugal transfer pilus assembly protein TraL